MGEKGKSKKKKKKDPKLTAGSQGLPMKGKGQKLFNRPGHEKAG